MKFYYKKKHLKIRFVWALLILILGLLELFFSDELRGLRFFMFYFSGIDFANVLSMGKYGYLQLENGILKKIIFYEMGQNNRSQKSKEI